MSNIELLTCRQVMRLTGIRSRTTIWRRIRWRSSDIDEWIEPLSLRRY